MLSLLVPFSPIPNSPALQARHLKCVYCEPREPCEVVLEWVLSKESRLVSLSLISTCCLTLSTSPLVINQE